MTSVPPPRAVLRAFGVTEARPLATPTWIAGNVVLKPETDPELQEWWGTVAGEIVRSGFRLADPVRASDGSWVVDGWVAARWVEGASVPSTGPSAEGWGQVIKAGRAFHRAVAHLGRPAFVDRRDSWWARADRRAWGEAVRVEPLPELAAAARVLEAACRPLGESQVVHADLGGNVLLADELAPAIIDVSPYWRPPAFAEGVVVADALCWHGADASLLGDLGVSVPAVARAMLFRLWTTHERVLTGVGRKDLAEEVDAYAGAVGALGL